MESRYLKYLCVFVIGVQNLGLAHSLCHAPSVALDLNRREPSVPRLWISTVDHFYTAGALRAVDPLNWTLDPKSLPTSPDSMIRSLPGAYLYVVNRRGRDSIQIIDKETFEMVGEFSVGRQLNAMDIAVVGETAYITRQQSKELLVCGLNPIRQIKTLDLSAYADQSDKIPEMAAMAMEGDLLYIQLQRLDSLNKLAVKERGKVVVLNTKSEEIEAIDLEGKNPYGEFRREGNSFYLAMLGEWGKKDGGIEEVGRGIVLGEESLGGDILDFVFIEKEKGIALVATGTSQTKLVQFDLANQSVQILKESSAPFYQGWNQLLLLPQSDSLLIGDRGLKKSGVLLWDESKKDFVRSLDVGMPPYSMGGSP